MITYNKVTNKNWWAVRVNGEVVYLTRSKKEAKKEAERLKKLKGENDEKERI